MQRESSLLVAVKREVDRDRRPGDFLLTGSANLLLSHRVSESLAGRAVYLDLPPFCPCEWLERPHRLAALDALFEPDFESSAWPEEPADWMRWLLWGGFPPVLALKRSEARDIWFRGYVQTFLERDLRNLSAVGSLPDFQRCTALVANQAACVINQASLARDAALSHATAHRYLNLLEMACLITRIPPFTASISTGVVKSPRWCWADCGLAAWLAGIRSERDLSVRPDAGQWLEQTLFQTLNVWRALDPGARQIFFWRDRAGREVGFVLKHGERLVAVEIKAARRVGLDDARGITAFRKTLGREGRTIRGVVLHAGESRRLGEDLHALSFGWMVPASAD